MYLRPECTLCIAKIHCTNPSCGTLTVWSLCSAVRWAAVAHLHQPQKITQRSFIPSCGSKAPRHEHHKGVQYYSQLWEVDSVCIQCSEAPTSRDHAAKLHSQLWDKSTAAIGTECEMQVSASKSDSKHPKHMIPKSQVWKSGRHGRLLC